VKCSVGFNVSKKIRDVVRLREVPTEFIGDDPLHPPACRRQALEKEEKDIKEEAMETVIPAPIFIGINSSGNPGLPLETET